MTILRSLLITLALLWAQPVDAANRIWNPYSVTGAISGTGGVCRLTISPAIVGGGLVAGDTIISTSITGATGCNVTATISTVVDTTHIELTGTTFGGAYVSGGCVAGGHITTTNTANWAASSTATCGSGGQSVPGSGDAATLDANSLGGVVIVDNDFTWQSFTAGAFNGTFDNSANHNLTATLTGCFSWTGSGTRTILGGSGTYTCSAVNATWTVAIVTGLTNPTTAFASSLLVFSGNSTSTTTFATGGLTYGTVTFNGQAARGGILVQQTGATIANLTVGAPNNLILTGGITLTVSTSLNLAGTSANPIGIMSNNPTTTATLSVGAAFTGTFVAMRAITLSGAGSLAVTSGFDLGANSGAGLSITGPASGGGSKIICGTLGPGKIPANDNGWLKQCAG